MNDNKQLPTVEYSLKSVSWHLKTISESINTLNERLLALLDKSNTNNNSNNGMPF